MSANPTTSPTTAPADKPKKVTKAKKIKIAAEGKKTADHPKYEVMIVEAIKALKEQKGSSKLAILKYILSHYNVGNDSKLVNSRLRLALKRAVKLGHLKQPKGVGASGSFKVGEKKTAETKPKVKKVPAKSPKKTAAKPKATAKPKKSPKKVVKVKKTVDAAPAAKKPASKAKKTVTPKKSPTKTAAKKTTVKPKTVKPAAKPKSSPKAKKTKPATTKASPKGKKASTTKKAAVKTN